MNSNINRNKLTYVTSPDKENCYITKKNKLKHNKSQIKKHNENEIEKHNSKIANINTNNKINKKKNKSCFILEKYIILEMIASGSFGEVYVAINRENGEFIAAKVENKNNRSIQIPKEFHIYKYLHKNNYTIGVPKIFDLYQTPKFNIMFMQLLGVCLEDLFNKYNRRFKLPTVLLLALKLIDLIENLHNSGYIHRDIKPNNFLIGRGNDIKKIYILDFGLSKKYINKGKHMEFKTGKSLTGTTRYVSINTHLGFEPSRRDDLESIGYMLVYFLKGSLPWQGLKQKKITKLIGDKKLSTSLDDLCKDLPDCFKYFLDYCRKLKFDQKPDYKYLKNMFINCCKNYQIIPKFEWINLNK